MRDRLQRWWKKNRFTWQKGVLGQAAHLLLVYIVPGLFAAGTLAIKFPYEPILIITVVWMLAFYAVTKNWGMGDRK